MNRGKDKQIRLWDAIGGMCVQNLADCLGEITSVEFDREGKYLLAGCKDNSNRLFDLRMVRLNLLLSSFGLSIIPLLICFPTSSLELKKSSLELKRRLRENQEGELMVATKHIQIHRSSEYIQEPDSLAFRLE